MYSFLSFINVVKALESSLYASLLPLFLLMQESSTCLFLFPPLYFSHSLIFPLFLPSLSMPWVGGNHRRWEMRAQVCAGNHGNPVLIGQWPGRMIVSCCQWGLFMQTGSRVGQPQMGPSDMRRRGTRRRIYSLYLQFELWNQFLEKLKLLLEWISFWCLVCVSQVCVCDHLLYVRIHMWLSTHEKQQHQSFKFPKNHIQITFRWQSPVAAIIITPVFGGKGDNSVLLF